MSNKRRSDYFARASRIYTHFDWFLREALSQSRTDAWSIQDIREAMKAYTEVKPQAGTIERYLAERFSVYHCAPLRRTGEKEYVLDECYYQLLANEIYPPRMGKRGPIPGRCRGRGTAGFTALKERWRSRQKWYRRIHRHPEEYVKAVFGKRQSASIDELVDGFDRLGPEITWYWQRDHIRRLLDNYVDEVRGPPYVERDGQDRYRVTNGKER